MVTYLRFHPLAFFWLSVAFLVITGDVWTRRRRLPKHPYPESTRWRYQVEEPGPAPVPLAAGAQVATGPAGQQADSAGAPAYVGSAFAGAVPGAAAAGTIDRGLLDDGRLHNGRLDGRMLDPERLDAERLDPGPLEDARPYVGQTDGHREPSRRSRSGPLDSTEPMPQLSDRQ